MSMIRSLVMGAALSVALLSGAVQAADNGNGQAAMTLNKSGYRQGESIRVNYRVSPVPADGQLLLMVVPADDAYSSSMPDGYVGSMKPVRLPALESGGASIKIPRNLPSGDYVARIITLNEVSFRSTPLAQTTVFPISGVSAAEEQTAGEEYKGKKE